MLHVPHNVVILPTKVWEMCMHIGAPTQLCNIGHTSIVDLCSSILSMCVGKFHTSVYSTAMNDDQGHAGKKRCG